MAMTLAGQQFEWKTAILNPKGGNATKLVRALCGNIISLLQ